MSIDDSSKLISQKAQIGKGLILGTNVIIGDNAIIGDNVKIGHNSLVDDCNIGSNTSIENNCIIGYSNATGWVSRETPKEELQLDKLVLGEGCLIREGCTIYAGSSFGAEVKVHHKALIREKTHIGAGSSIGSMCDLEGNLTIGRNCSIHSNVHLCYDTTIGDYVFIAPFAVTTNGNPMSYKRPKLYEIHGYEKGPIIEYGCQLAVHSIILPRVRVGYESIIGPSAVVSKDVAPLSILIGSPGKLIGKVEEYHRLPSTIREEIARTTYDKKSSQ